MRPWQQTLVALAAFALGTAIAEVAGADSLGIAMTVGQIALALAVVGLMLWA